MRAPDLSNAVWRLLIRDPPKPAVGALPEPLKRVQMRDEKPPRRQAGQSEANEQCSKVEACRAGHDTGMEPVEGSGTGAEDDRGRARKSAASPEAQACKCPRGHGESKNQLGPEVPGISGSEPSTS